MPFSPLFHNDPIKKLTKKRRPGENDMKNCVFSSNYGTLSHFNTFEILFFHIMLKNNNFSPKHLLLEKYSGKLRFLAFGD
jgi:hypothetical protein